MDVLIHVVVFILGSSRLGDDNLTAETSSRVANFFSAGGDFLFFNDKCFFFLVRD